jgi:hypothetical protein
LPGRPDDESRASATSTDGKKKNTPKSTKKNKEISRFQFTHRFTVQFFFQPYLFHTKLIDFALGGAAVLLDMFGHMN